MRLVYGRNKVVYYLLVSLIFGTNEATLQDLAQEDTFASLFAALLPLLNLHPGKRQFFSFQQLQRGQLIFKLVAIQPQVLHQSLHFMSCVVLEA